LRALLERSQPKSEMVGDSAAMREVFRLIERAGPSDKAILIQGESGTGKELVARAIHNKGPRSEAPFVTINCAAVPAQLLESELFGHVRGSFTGADRDKQGLFVAAEDGTLMLDEIGEMPMEMQPKLLRVLEDRKVRPVGATQEIPIHARVLAATNRDLQLEAGQGRFREDLFYRLNVIQIDVPPLRQRPDDVPLLAEHFLELFADSDRGGGIGGFSREAKQLLESYSWPGNVRELENAVRRAVTLERDTSIQPDSLPDAVRGRVHGAAPLHVPARHHAAGPGVGDERTWGSTSPGAAIEAPLMIPDEGLDLEEHLAEIRRVFMSRALQEAGGVQKKAAARLGMSFRSFRYYLDKLDLRADGAVADGGEGEEAAPAPGEGGGTGSATDESGPDGGDSAAAGDSEGATPS